MLCNLQITLLDSKVGVTAKDVLNLLFCEPENFIHQPFHAELSDLGGSSTSPITERATKWTSSIRLPKPDPFLRSVRLHQGFKSAIKEGRRYLLDVVQAVESERAMQIDATSLDDLEECAFAFVMHHHGST